MKARIIVADDHKILREGLRTMLEKTHGFDVVAEAENGFQTVQAAKKHKPEIIIMDITMPDMNGIEATRQILKDLPSTKIIGLSMHSDKKFVTEMIEAGASGYLLKDCAFEELTRAVQTVLSNRLYVSPDIAGEIIKSNIQSVLDGVRPLILTSKEREVLQLIAEGRSTKEIAGLLNVSVKTIETHRVNIMEKLKVYSVAELTKFAIREGLTSLDH